MLSETWFHSVRIGLGITCLRLRICVIDGKCT